MKKPIYLKYDTLERLYQQKKAYLDVDRINHREFIYDGVRYFAGWSSERDPNYVKPTDRPSWETPEYKVLGWAVYKAEAA